jgi:hypothetical protein
MVAMWLNVDKDGNGMQSAFHAVQAHPSHYGERMIAKVSFPRKSNILAAGYNNVTGGPDKDYCGEWTGNPYCTNVEALSMS